MPLRKEVKGGRKKQLEPIFFHFICFFCVKKEMSNVTFCLCFFFSSLLSFFFETFFIDRRSTEKKRKKKRMMQEEKKIKGRGQKKAVSLLSLFLSLSQKKRKEKKKSTSVSPEKRETPFHFSSRPPLKHARRCGDYFWKGRADRDGRREQVRKSKSNTGFFPFFGLVFDGSVFF